MIQNILFKSSKMIPTLIKKAYNYNINNSIRIIMKNNLYKNNILNFSDKNVKGKKDAKDKAKENKGLPNKNEENTKNNKQTDVKKPVIEIQSKDNIIQNENLEEIDINAQIKIIDEDKELDKYQKESLKQFLEALTEKDQILGEEKFINALVEQGEKILGIEDDYIKEEKKDFESTKISHNYEKEFGLVNRVEKDFIEKITKDFLRDYKIDDKESEIIKERRRDIISYSLFEKLRDLKTSEDVLNHVRDYTDFKNFEFTLEKFDNLVQLHRETRDLDNPTYLHLRSINKLLKNEEIMTPKERNIDTRQNALSDDYLKIQPRLKIDYAYNYEQNKEFQHTFDKIFDEDQKKLIQKMKLIKYIKTYPNKFGVKNRWLAKHFNVPIEKLPDYDVDINEFKPEPTKKAKRRFQKRIINDISNYEAWRVFDRIPTFCSAEDNHYNVELIPINLINRFGPASSPFYEESTGVYIFEDENLDVFLLTDYKQTTIFHGPNYTNEFYEEQKIKVQPKLHKKKWPSPSEFWDSSDLKEFKLYYHTKSDIKKFKRWLRYYVNRFDSTKEIPISQINEEKYGHLDDYSDFKMERKTKLLNAIYNYSPSYFMEKDEKVYFKPETFLPPKYISLEEGELFDYDEYLKIEASKSKDLNK